MNRACPLEADFTFRFDREPDFFAWSSAVFDSAEYQGAYVGDRLAGYCVAGLRTGWTGQGWGPWVYAGDLRILPEFRGRGLVRRLTEAVFENLPDDVAAGFFIVKRGNRAAERTAASLQPPPRYAVRPIGVFEAVSLPLLGTGRRGGGDADCRAARVIDIPALAALLRRAWAGRLFAPQVTEDWLARAWSGAAMERVLVAERAGSPVGVIAWRDYGDVRRTTILRYSRGAWPMRVLWSLARRRNPAIAPLPEPGEPLRAASVTQLVAEGDDPEVLRALVRSAMRAQAGEGRHLLQIGAMRGEGVGRALRGMLRSTFCSDVWVTPEGWGPAASVAAARPPFIDLAIV